MDRKEEIIIKRAQKGDHSAFEKLVQHYDKQVMILAYRFLHDTEDVKDAYQEIFLRVFRNIDKFRFDSEFSSWLYRIVVNFCINFSKKRKHFKYYSIEEQLAADEDFWHVVPRESGKNPEEQYLAVELDNTIKKALDSLSPHQRAVFILKHYQGYKLSEIAKVMNCKEGTVKNHLFRAIQKMRQAVRNYST